MCEKCGVTVSDRLHDITRPEWNNILGIGKTNKELAEQGFLLLQHVMKCNAHHNAEINDM